MVIYVVKAVFWPGFAANDNPANARVARGSGLWLFLSWIGGKSLPKQARYQLRYTRLFSFLSGWAYSPQKPRCKMDAVSRSGAEYALSALYIRLPSCPDAPLCRALKCLYASNCRDLPFLHSPPPGLPVFFATPTGRCRAKASLRGLRPNRAGTSCKQSFYSLATKTLYTIL